MANRIDDSGRLNFGKHCGEDIENVAQDDPSYLEWCLREMEDLSEEDREVIRTSLIFAKRTRSRR